MNLGIAKQREPCSRSPKNTVEDVRSHVLHAVATVSIGRSSSSSSNSSSITSSSSNSSTVVVVV
jgi:hypothetical protein